MKNMHRCFVLLIVSFCALAFLLTSEALAWRAPWRRHAAPRAVRTRTYKYIRSHDLNNDGGVTVKDRLLWIRKNKGSVGVIYVSEDNEDLVEAMDLDGDGDVESWEMEKFYLKYDTNKNGALEDSEIDAACD